MNTKSLKISWITLMVAGVVVIVSGLLMFIAPEFFLVNEFNGYTGQVWSDFEAANPEPMSFFLLEATQMGLFMITLGIMVVAVVYFAYRTRQKWSWYLILIAVTLGAGGPVLTNLPTGDVVSVALAATLLVVSYIALAIGARSILGSTSGATTQRFSG